MPDTDTATTAAANTVMLLIRANVLVTHQPMPHVGSTTKAWQPQSERCPMMLRPRVELSTWVLSYLRAAD